MNLSKKRVAVFGMARSGISAIKLLVAKGAHVTAVNRGAPATWKAFNEVSALIGAENCVAEDDSKSIFSSSELIILSPGIPREHEVLSEAIANGVDLWCEVELGYRLLNNLVPIVAITGTNGKTTTVSMLGDVLSNTGKKVFVGGNIGVPFCEYLLDGEGADYIVLELSSFQLESLVEFRPNIAAVLNIFPNHGERYSSVESYANAKFNIVNKMSKNDLLIYSKTDPYLKRWGSSVSTRSLGLDTSNYEVALEKINSQYSLENFKLLGGHNLTNLLFVKSITEELGIEKKHLQKSIDEFCGVEFRCQYIESNDLFSAYNDGKSTNWDAVKTAVKAIPQEKDVILIVGGQRRGRGDTLIPHFDVLNRCKEIYLMGETTDQFADELAGNITHHKLYDLPACIKKARDSQFEGYLLFSPGLPSYDQYEHYIKRGEHFTNLINNQES